MGIPTITTVSPATGPTKGGNVVEITGTNFRLPPTPPAVGFVGGDAQVTVAVQFGGVASAEAHALTATRLYARVPAWAGAWDTATPAALAVRVANLDDAGVEIPTENVTKANAYTVDRPSLQALTDWQRFIYDGVVTFLRRHLLMDVWVRASRDYDANPADGENEPMEAVVPRIELAGPTVREDRENALNRLDPEADGATYFRRLHYPRTVELDFDVTGFASSERGIFGLAQAFILLFRDHDAIPFLRVGGAPSSGIISYEALIPFDGQPSFGPVDTADGLRTFGAILRVCGVDLDETDGLVIERGRTVYDDIYDEVQEVP
jgi:hypothetical protein